MHNKRKDIHRIKRLVCFGAEIPVIIKDLGPEFDGEYCLTNKTITIKPYENERHMLHSILHEGFHAVVDRTGIDQTELSNDTQEIICQNFATFILENFDLKILPWSNKKITDK